MTQEQIDQYTKIGTEFNGSIDYETGLSNPIPIPEPAQDSISYIILALRSGLDSDYLSDNEIILLNDYLPQWRTMDFCKHKDTNNSETEKN